MANKIGRKLKNAAAVELAERGLLDDGYAATNPGLRAFVLEDASYLTEIRAKTWVLWRSKEAYEHLMASVVTGRASDPVLDAVGTPGEFIRLAPELASQLRKLLSVDSVDWASALASVDRKVVTRTGSYWIEEPERLRMLIAFVGEFLHEQKGWTWATDSGDGVILVQPGGRRASPGRVIVAQADEARKGEFALADVLEELEQNTH
ncbi:MAG TPA: hypothetical protein VHP33_19935 [Polyangiaceae bacterium]|nr:hypothetical protein [Polyangiaceae bacterium]